MARTKFTPENTAVIVAQVRAGVALAAAARDIGVRDKTAEGWLTRGRKEESTAYSDFAEKIDDAREAHKRAVLTRDEYEKHLAKAVRGGSVQAMKLWWEIHGKAGEEDPDAVNSDPMDALESEDELAQKRRHRSA